MESERGGDDGIHGRRDCRCELSTVSAERSYAVSGRRLTSSQYACGDDSKRWVFSVHPGGRVPGEHGLWSLYRQLWNALNGALLCAFSHGLTLRV
jgi:hypothetical protein